MTRFLVGKEPAEGGFPQWCLDHGGAALSNLPNADAETIRCVCVDQAAAEGVTVIVHT